MGYENDYQPDTADDEFLDSFYANVNCGKNVLAVFSIVANTILIAFIVKTKCYVENATNKFIWAIIGLDLCLGICFATPYFNQDHLNDWTKSVTYSIFLSLINLQFVLSADRYWKVCRSMTNQIRRNEDDTKWIILMCIITGFFIGFGFPIYRCVVNRCGAGSEDVQLKFMKFLFAWEIFAVLATVYFNVAFIRFKSASQSGALTSNAPSEAIKALLKQQKRVSVTVALIIGSFLLYWISEALLTADHAFANDALRESVLRYFFDEKTAFTWGKVLLYSSYSLTVMNAVVDPLIFIWRTEIIRGAIKNFICCKPPPTVQPTEDLAEQTIFLQSIKPVEP